MPFSKFGVYFTWPEEHVVRYRLRFLLQEFDLPRGPTVIGRSLDCHLSIADPLVSREHAKITIDDDGARVEDLRSRNGVRLNGLMVHEPTALSDGDRLRIGTRDFVFSHVNGNAEAESRTTGVLRLCAKCRLPYARGAVACPHCAATEQTEEEPTTGTDDYRTGWSVQLMAGALERALGLGRMADAERIARRTIADVDELIRTGGPIDETALDAVAAEVAAMSVATEDPGWVLWVCALYHRTARAPSAQAATRIVEASAKHGGMARDALHGLLEGLQSLPRCAPGR